MKKLMVSLVIGALLVGIVGSASAEPRPKTEVKAELEAKVTFLKARYMILIIKKDDVIDPAEIKKYDDALEDISLEIRLYKIFLRKLDA